MTRLAYAIARDLPDSPLPGETARLSFEGLAIIHGPSPADAASPGLESLRAFASTVETLHARETVLPLRFGSLHETEAELEAVLALRLDDWRVLLDQVEGCDEMGLRVLLDKCKAVRVVGEPAPSPSPEAPPPRPGLAYLASRRAEIEGRDAFRAEAERVETVVLEALQGLHRRSVVEGPGPAREGLLSLVFLVHRAELAAFRSATQALQDRDLGRILSTGPWPPYHFASPPPSLP